jgi:hypothetical protein
MSGVTRCGTSGCLLALVLALASACGKPVAGEPRAAENAVRTAPKTTTPSRKPTTSAPRTSSGKPSTSDVLKGLVGTWEGEYTCAQGNTGLTLTVMAPASGTLPTTFAFFPLAGNPSAKKGSYSMVGAISPAGQLVFKQQQWIDQPEGYAMVDLAVTSPLTTDGTQLSGDVLMDNCKGFSVRKR